MASILRVSSLTFLRSNRINCNSILAPTVTFSSTTGSDDSNNDGPSKGKNEVKNEKDVSADEKPKPKSVSKNRLHDLLEQMSTESVFKMVKNIESPRPKGYRAIKEAKDSVNRPDPKQTQNLDEAAAQVADVIGGDIEKTKSELLSKLKTKASTEIADLLATEKRPKGKKQPKVVKKEKDDEVVTVSTVQRKVVDEVADKETAEFIAGFKAKSENKTDVTDFLSKMEVEKFDSVRTAQRRTDRFTTRPRLPRQPQTSSQGKDAIPYSGTVKLFESPPLGIFSSANVATECRNSLNIWGALEKHELDVITSRPPSNYYEKMILWTEQGKVWHFPIDNEQGLDEEAQFSFEQHVFLEPLLDPWCPKNGPVRIFMELVCVGLSKNPYLSVKQKHEHIEWYKNYFDEKKEILARMVVQQKQEAGSQPLVS